MKSIGIEMEQKVKSIISEISSEKCPDELHLVSKYFWLWQLDKDEYPIENDSFDEDSCEQRDMLSKELKQKVCNLKALAENNNIDAITLLGQYYYDASKFRLLEDLLFAEDREVREVMNDMISEVSGISVALSNSDDLSKRRDIKQQHEKAAQLFLKSLHKSEEPDYLVKYYLYKLECEGALTTAKDEERTKILMCDKSLRLLIELGVNNVKLLAHIVQKEQARSEAVKAKNELAAVHKKLEEHSQQLAKILSMIYHNLTPQIEMLWSCIERPDHNQVFRESISNMSLLLDIAKNASKDPAVISKAMLEEPSGDETLDKLFEASIHTAMINLLSERTRDLISQHYFAFAVKEKLIPADVNMLSWHNGYGQVKQDIQRCWYKSFQDTPPDQINEWYKKHLGGICINVNTPSLKIIKHGDRYGILQSILMELFSNAVKYSGALKVDTVKLMATDDDGFYNFCCENAIDPNLASTGKGSGRGHDFINLILETIGQDRLKVVKSNDKYSVSFCISKKLLGG